MKDKAVRYSTYVYGHYFCFTLGFYKLIILFNFFENSAERARTVFDEGFRVTWVLGDEKYTLFQNMNPFHFYMAF